MKKQQKTTTHPHGNNWLGVACDVTDACDVIKRRFTCQLSGRYRGHVTLFAANCHRDVAFRQYQVQVTTLWYKTSTFLIICEHGLSTLAFGTNLRALQWMISHGIRHYSMQEFIILHLPFIILCKWSMLVTFIIMKIQRLKYETDTVFLCWTHVSSDWKHLKFKNVQTKKTLINQPLSPITNSQARLYQFTDGSIQIFVVFLLLFKWHSYWY